MPYRDPITGAVTYNCSADYHDFVNIDNDAISIPINQWFLVEVYLKRSLGRDRRYFAAINGQTIGDTMQPDYGVDFEEIRDMYWVSLYDSLANGSEWIDDLEIWDTPPCGTPPCSSGTSTTYTGPVPPFMTSRAGAVGEVGMPFSFQVTATGNPTNYYVSGTLPLGLSIDHVTGVISGMPASAGTSKCYIEATNSVGKGAQWLEFQINNAATTAPTISSFSASSSTINAGEWVQLTWTQNGAASLSIDQGIGDVTGADPYSVRPNATTTYTLTATNAAGVVRASVTVNVTNGTTGSIKQIQANDNQGSSVTSVSAPFPSANTAGNMILAFVRASTTTQTVMVTDSVGNSYTHAVAQNQTADGHQIHFFYANNIKPGNNTVTATFSATNNHPYIAVYEYSGLNTSSPLDQIASAQGSSASPSCGPTPRSTSANELAISGLGMANNFTGTVTAGPGWTILKQNTSTSRAANESENLSINGTVTAPFALSVTTKWSCILATFKP